MNNQLDHHFWLAYIMGIVAGLVFVLILLRLHRWYQQRKIFNNLALQYGLKRKPFETDKQLSLRILSIIVLRGED